jgi:Cu+-exporting ATPase
VTSAPAAASATPAALRLTSPLRRLVLPAAAVVLTAALAVGSPSMGHLLAVVFAAALLVLSFVVLRGSREVRGARRVPRPYAGIAAAAILLTFVVRGGISGWAAGSSATVAVALAAAPGALLVAAEAPLRRALHAGRAVGVTLLDTAALAPVEMLALNGTGPLIDGKVVSAVDPVEESHLRNLRWFAGALAHAVDTPIARAVAHLAGRGNVSNVVTSPEETRGSVDRHPVRLSLASSSTTPWDVIQVQVDSRVLGTVTVADALREDAAASVAALRAQGVTTVVVAPAEDPRASEIAAAAGCALVPAAPEGSALVADDAIAGGLLLGPASQELRLAQACVGQAAHALTLTRSVSASTARATRVALGWHGATVVLAAVGLLVPWAAGVAALAGCVVAGTIAWRGVRSSVRGG